MYVEGLLGQFIQSGVKKPQRFFPDARTLGVDNRHHCSKNWRTGRGTGELKGLKTQVYLITVTYEERNSEAGSEEGRGRKEGQK